MILSKFNVYVISVRLVMHDGKSGSPIYVINYSRGPKTNYSYIHRSISYTREQAFDIYKKIVLYLTWRYLHLQ